MIPMRILIHVFYTIKLSFNTYKNIQINYLLLTVNYATSLKMGVKHFTDVAYAYVTVNLKAIARIQSKRFK